MTTVTQWLRPIRSAVPELDDQDWERLHRLAELLACQWPTSGMPGGGGDRRTGGGPPGGGQVSAGEHGGGGGGQVGGGELGGGGGGQLGGGGLGGGAPAFRWPAGGMPGGGRVGDRLLRLRAELAEEGFTRMTLPGADGGLGRPAVVQTLAQFVCGFYDLDLRDATGLGHGALALDLKATAERRAWLDRLAAGELVGIAATERHGGSRLNEITTRARRVDGDGNGNGNGDCRWVLCGEKVWVSRLAESSGFVVVFRDPDGELSAALVDADHDGLERQQVAPSGLAGWTWGTLAFREVELDVDTVLIGAPGDGTQLFHRHFARFRPLVTATALGAAAAAHSIVARTLAARQRIGVVSRIRDNAYISLGRGYAEICAALLAAVATTRLAALDDAAAVQWAKASKASGVDTAYRVVGELVPLVGASGFTAESRLVKIRNDLAALLYADGMHDTLYRAVGRLLLEPA